MNPFDPPDVSNKSSLSSGCSKQKNNSKENQKKDVLTENTNNIRRTTSFK
eukprot:m.277288 g.277288  ORF g.277288 m.277288 type:complete len:50 (+) comp16305_c0_seq38:9197-9346(+)